MTPHFPPGFRLVLACAVVGAVCRAQPHPQENRTGFSGWFSGKGKGGCPRGSPVGRRQRGLSLRTPRFPLGFPQSAGLVVVGVRVDCRIAELTKSNWKPGHVALCCQILSADLLSRSRRSPPGRGGGSRTPRTGPV